MSLSNDNSQESLVNFSELKNIVLIGGGDLMAESAKIFHALKFNVTIIAAKRHINEQLVLTDETLKQACQPFSLTQHALNDINNLFIIYQRRYVC